LYVIGALEIVPGVEAEGVRRSAYKDRPPLEGGGGSAAITVAKYRSKTRLKHVTGKE
jgi:hypothetical protein